MKARTIRFLLLVIISALVGYVIGITNVKVSWLNYHPQVVVSNKEPPPGLTNINMQQFWNVLDKLQTLYYDKTKLQSQKLLDGAISGMVNSLDDPYTLYLPPVQNDDFKQNLAGKFEGIGAELGVKDKQIIVVAPLDGSPSQKAGLKTGDAILAVDNVSTAGWDLNKAVDKIRGPKGSSVTLTIARKGEDKTRDIKITRDEITVKSVTAWTKSIKDIDGINKNAFGGNTDAKVAYIRLSQFGDNTNQEWLPLTNKISNEISTDKSVKGIILDLRNNPGGYLTDAVFIASEFIKDGTVVYQDDGREKTPLDVSRKGLLTDVPVVVLINKGSASAAEITAGALRDHGRAKLVGETSFGKGTVQQAEDLGGGAGLHVTIARWLTPNGTWVGNGKNGEGLKPDVEVALDPKDPTHDTQLEKAIQTLLQ